MKLIENVLVLLLLGFMTFTCPAQGGVDRSAVVLAQLNYGIQWPGEDLQTRFGQNFELGGGISFLSKKNLYLGLTYGFIFGNQVKEDVLSNLRTREGGIIGRDMQFADIFLRERGNQLLFQAGYLFDKNTTPQRCGFLISGGIGMLTHKVRIVDEFDAVVQVLPPHVKGYDRLTSGVSLHQSFRYIYLSENKLLNFFVSVDLTEGFTKDRRGFNYNSGLTTNQNRVDLLMGVKIGWIIPLYLQQGVRYY